MIKNIARSTYRSLLKNQKQGIFQSIYFKFSTLKNDINETPQNNKQEEFKNPLESIAGLQQQQQKTEKLSDFYTDEQLDYLMKIPSFLQATKYASEENFELAELNFDQTLEILEKDMEQKQIDTVGISIAVLKKYLIILKVQEKEDKLKLTLEKLFFMNLSYYQFKDKDHLKVMRSLFTHYCIFDVDRGLALIQAVFKDETKFTRSVKKEVFMYQGLLNGLQGLDFEKSTKYLEKGLDIGLSPIMKGVAQNNLAMFIWWTNLKNIQEQFIAKQQEQNNNNKENQESGIDQNQEKYDFMQKLLQKIPENSDTILKYLKKSIHSFEFEDKSRQQDQISAQQFQNLKQILQTEKDNANLESLDQVEQKDIVIKNPMSAIAAMNIGEFYYQMGAFQQSQFWLTLALKSGSQTMSLSRVIRAMVFQAQIMGLNQKDDFAEKILLDCLDYSENFLTFNKIFALETYIEFLKKQNRTFEACSYQQQALKLRAKVKYWDERKENLIIPDYYLQF